MSESTDHIDYEQRALLFCDVLGWKEAVQRSVNDTYTRDTLGYAVAEAKHQQDLIGQIKAQGRQQPLGVEVAHVSDTIVYSCLDSPGGRGLILGQAADLVYHFLDGNIPLLCRGAVVNGLLYHRDNVVFGPGLVEAVRLEQELALYPRFLLAKDFIDSARPEAIRRDADGLCSLNVFVLLIAKLGDELAKMWFEEIREKLRNGLKQANDPKSRAKWSYAAHCFNDALNHLFPASGKKLVPIPEDEMMVALA